MFDPVLKRKPQCSARLVRDMSLRGLVSFGAQSEATVGFLWSQGNRGLFLIPVGSISTFGGHGIVCCPHLHPGRAYNSQPTLRTTWRRPT